MCSTNYCAEGDPECDADLMCHESATSRAGFSLVSVSSAPAGPVLLLGCVLLQVVECVTETRSLCYCFEGASKMRVQEGRATCTTALHLMSAAI